jgi:PD-(D/E)XK endonuclease
MPAPGNSQPPHGGALPPRHRHSKRKGELAELAFVYKAAGLGFGVAKPYGDSERYDFIVDSGERLWKVQVKSTSAKRYRAYQMNVRRNDNGRLAPYDPSEIDFVVAHVVPEDIWYVVPVHVFASRRFASFYPSNETRVNAFSKYREAWWLLRPASGP